jgi:EAL domain-containing protein (putative c-di-GMP-specific phosphodiesterase class I)
VEDTIAKMEALASLGIQFALDDFGTGYSSLSYLKRLPLTQLKIDRSFVRDLEGPMTNPIISAITGIARGFELELVAEGVENEDQARALRGLGCDVMQGYLFARPAAAAAAHAWLLSPEQLFQSLDTGTLSDERAGLTA